MALTDPSIVLAKEIVRAGKQLGLKQDEVANAIGASKSEINGERTDRITSLDPVSKQGELALLVIRIEKSLFSLAGGDESWVKLFMHSQNKMTGGVPAQQIASEEGLRKVLLFVDAMQVMA